MSVLSVSLVKDLAVQYRKRFPDAREGQALYVCALSLDRGLIEATKGTEMDPFYDDSRIPLFLEYIERVSQ